MAADPQTTPTPEQRLANIKAFVTDPQRMRDWDGWRSAIASGDRSSWPRDAFEGVLSWVKENAMADDTSQSTITDNERVMSAFIRETAEVCRDERVRLIAVRLMCALALVYAAQREGTTP